MNVKSGIVLLAFLLIALHGNSQERSVAVKVGYGISNAYAPNGKALRSSREITEDVSSFTYKPGYQVGITKKLNLESGLLHITGQWQ